MHRPTELRAFLEGLGVHPKKRLSQNFLIDGNIVRKIVHFAEVKKGDLILEIGPGPGALTRALLETGAHVIAIEKDKTYADALPRHPHLEVYAEDFLDFPLEKQLKKKAKVVANLPYNVTTPILSKIIPLHQKIESITVMVQKEVAWRMTAKPKTADYSSLSLFLQFYSTPAYGFTVKPTCFFPRPKVDSAVVKLKLHAPPPVSSEEEFFKMVRTAFQKRRKMLRSSLNVDDTRRPEELSLSDFLRLFEQVEKGRHHEETKGKRD